MDTNKQESHDGVEEIVAEFRAKFKCIQNDCDGTGHIPEQTEDGWTSSQCQFHAEYLFPIEEFIRHLNTKKHE